MTKLAQQNSNANTHNGKRGTLYVREKGMLNSSFHERYIVLDGSKFLWYDSEADSKSSKARGTLVFNQNTKSSVYSDADEDDFKGFKITGEGDDVILQAPRYMVMKAWMNAVTKSVDELTGKKHTEVLETISGSALEQVRNFSLFWTILFLVFDRLLTLLFSISSTLR